MISVVVVTYNRHKSLTLCIGSLLNQSYKNYEIIIIDDGSKKQTADVIKLIQNKKKKIRYFRQERKGRGAARNLGLQKAKGDIVSFTDDDCTVPKNWLKSLHDSLEKHKEVAAVGGSILNADKNYFGEAAYILTFSAWLPLGKERIIDDIPTANIAYKKREIRGMRFPEEYKDLDYEDSFFNLGLASEGKKILFEPSIKVHHKAEVNSYRSLLKNQQRKALSFLLRGYKMHGLAGRLLVKFKFLNLFCPRLLFVLLRCAKSPKYLIKFFFHFPLILRGEFERALTIVKEH